MNKEPAGSASNVVHVDFSRKKTVEPALSRSAHKQRVFADMIEQGTVMLVFDARKQGVAVPSMLASKKDLRLNFCYSFQLPDFAFDEQGVRATLLFEPGLFSCEVPWDAVFMMISEVNQKKSVWPEDAPHTTGA